MRKQSLIIVYILIVFLIGCGGTTGETELKHPDKSPESLNDLSSGIDDIASSLDEIERIEMDLPSMEKEGEEVERLPETQEQEGTSQEGSNEESQGSPAQGSQESQGSEESQASQGSQNGQQSQKSEKSDQEIKSEKIEKKWQEIEKSLEEVHGFWNDYEIEGQKKGASREQLDSFENAINQLTNYISRKNVMESYAGISQLYLSLRPIFDLYLDDIMAELTNLKYDTYRAYVLGISDGEESDFQIFENNEELYTRLRHKLDDERKNELVDKLENSITSLKKGLKEENRRLNMIKKNIVLDNIDELEE